MTLKSIFYKYFSFSGRLNRKPFATRASLAYILILLVMLHQPIDNLAGRNIPVTILLFIAAWFLYAHINRRIHDLGRNSLWTLVMFIMANSIVLYIGGLIYLSIKKGDSGPNKYGDDPLAEPRPPGFDPNPPSQ